MKGFPGGWDRLSIRSILSFDSGSTFSHFCASNVYREKMQFFFALYAIRVN